eukprot:gene8846-biopygen13600
MFKLSMGCETCFHGCKERADSTPRMYMTCPSDAALEGGNMPATPSITRFATLPHLSADGRSGLRRFCRRLPPRALRICGHTRARLAPQKPVLLRGPHRRLGAPHGARRPSRQPHRHGAAPGVPAVPRRLRDKARTHMLLGAARRRPAARPTPKLRRAAERRGATKAPATPFTIPGTLFTAPGT